MDWGTVITALVAAFFGGGGIGSFFYVKETKRQKRIEADATAAEGWKALAERKLDIIEKKDAKIDELYGIIGSQRQTIDEQSSEIARLRIFKCVKIGCVDRHPPFGSTEKDFDYGNIKGIAE